MDASIQAALYRALADTDLKEVRRICEGMTRSERLELAIQNLNLRDILSDLNADRCLHCCRRIAKVPGDKIKGAAPGSTIWYHLSNGRAACPQGDTTAKPAPRND